MLLKKLTTSEFLEFTNNCQKVSFEQTEEMANLRKLRGYKIEFLGLVNAQNEVKVAALVHTTQIFGGQAMGIFYGPVYENLTDLELYLNLLKKYARNENALSLTIYPYEPYLIYNNDYQKMTEANDKLLSVFKSTQFHHSGFQIDYPNGEACWLYGKTLENITQDNLLQSFDKKGKSLVKKASTFGIKLRRLQKNELKVFKEITASTSSRRSYTDKTLEYYENFYDAWGEKAEFILASLNFKDYYANLNTEQENLSKLIQKVQNELDKQPNSTKKENKLRELRSQYETFEVRKKEAASLLQTYGEKDTPIAASLFTYSNKEAVYMNSGSLPEFNKFYAPALLQEYVMRKAIDLGIPYYNFLGISGYLDGSDGVLKFKQNFNGEIIQLIGNFTYYPQPFKYNVIQLIKKLLRRV